jgi:A/G-specific adenine glycosylase
MLQQTQVKRVLGYWPHWASTFPEPRYLAHASVSEVLAAWQGLGYNRRALALKRAADILVSDFDGCLPQSYEALLTLPGVGPATAAGVYVFAYNRPHIYLETNVRGVFLHHFFQGASQVADKELTGLIAACCDKKNPRGWYYALLDYGSYLKVTLPNPSRSSRHHTRQSPFEGSRRQKRAFLLRTLLAAGQASTKELQESLSATEKEAGRDALLGTEVTSLLQTLASEGFITSVGDNWEVIS